MLLRSLLIAAFLLLTGSSVWAQPAGASRGEAMAWSVVDDIVRVTTITADGKAGEEGFGFVFGVADGPLYIATADHVVHGTNDEPAPLNKIQVTFSNDQGHQYDAELLAVGLPRRRGDLAVLSVVRPENYVPRWPTYADVDRLQPGTRAWRIGKLGRWVPATSPGEFVGPSNTIWLAFDNLDTPPGSSGGPIVTEDGIIGMVVSDGGVSGAPSNVLPISTIRTALLSWHLPWSLPSAASVVRLQARSSADPAIAPSFALPGLTAPPPGFSLPPPTDNRPIEPPRSAFAAIDAARLGPPSGNATAATPPARPAINRSAAIESFVIHYYADASRQDAMLLLRAAYGQTVRFYGQSLTQDQVLGRQADAFRRWPIRDFSPQPNSITSGCDASARFCHAEGIVDYEFHNLERAAVSTGSERFVMDLDFSVSPPVIVGLQSSPIQRPVAQAAPASRWTTRSPSECGRHFYTWNTQGDLFEFTDEAGEIDVERVTTRGAETVVTETVSSTRRAGGAAVGTRWVYTFDPGGTVRVRNLATGTSFTLTRCGRV